MTSVHHSIIGPHHLPMSLSVRTISLSLSLPPDLFAIPDFSAGAMENWGLITYRETAVLYDEDTNPATSKQRVAQVVAHELAHQVRWEGGREGGREGGALTLLEGGSGLWLRS